MPNHTYPWKRFWYPREASIELLDGGYLYRPETEWANHFFGVNAIPLEELTSISCLILLGEPGLGKSQELRQQKNYIHDRLSEAVLWCDLNVYQEQSLLYQALFGSAKFQDWLHGTSRLHLFLDSLDEGLLSISTLARFLSVEFDRYRAHLSRLSLCLTCRAADWPSALEDQLRDLWGNANVRVFRLAPLRRDDVREAARVNGFSADQFLDEVDRKAAVPLANRPITLHFLLNLYRTHGTFPSVQKDLYEDGCRILCEEVSPSRRVAGFTGYFTARQHLAAAARLAYLMVFTNRNIVWNGVDLGDAPKGSLQLYECSGGTEDADGNTLPVGENLLNETLATALFFSHGSDRIEWAHRTYAAFLAARYLSSYQLPLQQIMMLLLHADESERRLVPQLHETATWLATMQPTVFREIIQIDPEVLLQSDMTTVSEQDRANLVEALLTLQPEERLWNVNQNLGLYYEKLLHPGLDGQLTSLISDRASNPIRRVMAIEIAEACHQQSLQYVLVTLALDPSEMHPIREAAAQAVMHMGDDSTKVRLKRLAVEKNDDDDDDQLKGYGLQALWPAHLAAEELFTALTPPKQVDFVGAYHHFLISQIVQHLEPMDLPVALNWVEKLSQRRVLLGRAGGFAILANEVMHQALEHLDVPGVLQACAKVILSRLHQFDVIISTSSNTHETPPWTDDDATRHLLLKALFSRIAQQNSDPTILFSARPPLLLTKDLPWLITYLAEAETEAIQRLTALLVMRIINSDDHEQVQTVLAASEHLPFLTNELAWLFRPVTLDSPEAEQMKQAWSLRQNSEPLLEPVQPSLPLPTLLEQIETQLNAFEQGDYAAWCYITQIMLRTPDDTGRERALKVDLTTFRTWETLEEPIRARLVEAAKKCMVEEGPDPQVWPGLDEMHYHSYALSCYQALYLVLQKEPNFLATVPRQVWTRLVPVILVSGLLVPEETPDGSNNKAQRRLVAAAHRYAPAELVTAIIRLLERQQRGCTSTYWNLLRNIEESWDTPLVDALLEKVSNRTLEPECTGSLLSILLVHTIEQARVQAASLLALPLPTNEQERQRAWAASQALILFTADAGWSVVWPAIQSDRDFGSKLIATIAYRSNWDAQQLSEDQIADLYLWVVHQYPPAQSPVHGMDFTTGVLNDIASLRERLLQQLKERGTREACLTLTCIASQTTQQNQAGVQWILLEAQVLTRQQTWMPYSSANILKVISNTRLRLIQNAEQLLEVVIESLLGLEATFRDETPAWRDVWDRIPCHQSETSTSVRRRRRREFTYRPIDENEFSDYVKRYLQADLGSKGIIANREVVIRSDERIDIRIDAVARNAREEVEERLSLIIEVKGCWNRELMTAMQTQLVDRYLKDNHCQHGLYLIGWFNCHSWDSEDDRKRRVLDMTIEQAQSLFDSQAATLSQQQVSVKALLLNAAIREING